MLAELIRRGDPGRLEWPYIIAEIGCNHKNDLQRAKLMIEMAAAGGADAVKFQAYRADTLAKPGAPSFWRGAKADQHTEFKESECFDVDFFRELKLEACVKGVEFMVTAFDPDLVYDLNPLVDVWKIASGDINCTPILRAVHRTGKPVCLSTGGSLDNEISSALGVLGDTTPVCVMQCSLSYPARYPNLGAIQNWRMRQVYGPTLLGYSDHTTDPDTMFLAWCMGAQVLETHFTDDTTEKGGDHYHSLTGKDLAKLRFKMKQALDWYGDGRKTVSPEEYSGRALARRSAKFTGGGEQEWLRPAIGVSDE